MGETTGLEPLKAPHRVDMATIRMGIRAPAGTAAMCMEAKARIMTGMEAHQLDSQLVVMEPTSMEHRLDTVGTGMGAKHRRAGHLDMEGELGVAMVD